MGASGLVGVGRGWFGHLDRIHDAVDGSLDLKLIGRRVEVRSVNEEVICGCLGPTLTASITSPAPSAVPFDLPRGLRRCPARRSRAPPRDNPPLLRHPPAHSRTRFRNPVALTGFNDRHWAVRSNHRAIGERPASLSALTRSATSGYDLSADVLIPTPLPYSTTSEGLATSQPRCRRGNCINSSVIPSGS